MYFDGSLPEICLQMQRAHRMLCCSESLWSTGMQDFSIYVSEMLFCFPTMDKQDCDGKNKMRSLILIMFMLQSRYGFYELFFLKNFNQIQGFISIKT